MCRKLSLFLCVSVAFMLIQVELLAAHQQIDKIVPGRINAGEQSKVFVFGRGFSLDNSAVTVNGWVLQHEVLSEYAICVDMPPLPPSEFPLVVQGTNGISERPIDVKPPDLLTAYDYLIALNDLVGYGFVARQVVLPVFFENLSNRLEAILLDIAAGRGEIARNRLRAFVNLVSATNDAHLLPRLKEVVLARCVGLDWLLQVAPPEPNPLGPSNLATALEKDTSDKDGDGVKDEWRANLGGTKPADAPAGTTLAVAVTAYYLDVDGTPTQDPQEGTATLPPPWSDDHTAYCAFDVPPAPAGTSQVAVKIEIRLTAPDGTTKTVVRWRRRDNTTEPGRRSGPPRAPQVV